jgi:Right handed beta helix region
MRAITLLLAALILSSGLCLQAETAQAQAPQTWVSANGDDTTNTCTTPSSPCQTFSGAYAKTASGGEINCLDSGPFGTGSTLEITTSITISCTGVTGGVQALANTSGFMIQAGPTDVVVIEGLDIEGGNTGFEGISIPSAASVTIRNCRIAGFVYGIRTQANVDDIKLLVVDSVIEDNGNYGIWLQPVNGTNVQATINRVEINNNKFGIVADGTAGTGFIHGTVRDSTVGNNSQNGITASQTTASNDTLVIDNVSVINNGNNGLAVSGVAAGLLVSNSTIFGNAGGVKAVNSGASIVYYGNNRLNGNNGNDGAFTSTIALH